MIGVYKCVWVYGIRAVRGVRGMKGQGRVRKREEEKGGVAAQGRRLYLNL